MEILLPSEKDFSSIADIFNSCCAQYTHIYSDQERKSYLLTEDVCSIKEQTISKIILIARLETNIAAYVVFRGKNEHCLWISGLYVTPDFQNQRIATMLLLEVEKIAKKMLFKIIALETHPKALHALNFYKKNGYSSIIRNIASFPYNTVLEGVPIEGRPLLGKII